VLPNGTLSTPCSPGDQIYAVTASGTLSVSILQT
jgi:hypothetical protein